MAESDAVGGGGTFPGVDGGARAMMGGSLPPRKRLLAGLKQNGSWGASSQALPSMPATVLGPEKGTIEDAVVVEISPSSAAGAGEAKGTCTSCGALESIASRKVKRNGTLQRVCNSCALLPNKNMSCLHCHVACPDMNDPSFWLQCYRCQHVVHVECEQRSSLSTRLDAALYLCPECVQGKMHVDLANGVTRAHGCGGKAGEEWRSESGSVAASVATDCPSPVSKKYRVSKELRSKLSETVAGDAGKTERICSNAEVGFDQKGSTSREAEVLAAEAAAALAGRAAVAAKATAAAKAAAAVKAAAAAKAALDTAALAARADAQARAELRRRSFLLEHIAVEGGLKYEAADLETRKERSEKPDVKREGEEIPGATLLSIDDEELARQLHRVINSSPRISRGLTPLRRKPSGQPGTVFSASDSVRVWPRSGLCAATEPRTQSKQQQTKPRSLSQKDVKRLECRVVKHESKTAESDSCQNSSQQLLCTTAPDDARQLVALKSEPVDSRTGNRVSLESGVVQGQDSRSASSDPLVKIEPEHVNGAMGQASNCNDGNQDGMPSGAAMLDEVLISEVSKEEAAKKGYMCTLRGGMDPHLEDDRSTSTSLIPAVRSVSARELEEQEGQQILDRGIVMDMCPGVATLAEVAYTAIEISEVPGGTLIDGQWSLDDVGDGLEADPDQDDFGQLRGNGPPYLSEFSMGKAKSALELEHSLSETLSQPSGVRGKAWQRGTVKGMPGGSQGFSRGVHISPFSSTMPIPIRTSALGSRSTTQQSRLPQVSFLP